MAGDSETNLSFPCPPFLAAHHQSNVTFSVPLGHFPFLPQTSSFPGLMARGTPPRATDHIAILPWPHRFLDLSDFRFFFFLS